MPLAKSWVEVQGEVYRPAIFELNPNRNERLSDVIDMAGGGTEYAFMNKVELSRSNASGQRSVYYIDYDEISTENDSVNNIELQNGDRIQIYSNLDQLPDRFVWIHGEVKEPGQYELEDNMHLSDLILKAGNLNRNAYLLKGNFNLSASNIF